MSTLTKMLKTCTGIVVLAGTQVVAQQVYPYFTGFEADTVKAYSSVDNIQLSGIKWSLPGVFLGEMTPSDRYHGSHAARIRLTENTTGSNGSLTMQEDFTEGIGTVSFYHAMYGSETGASLVVMYSQDNGVSWNRAGDTIRPGNKLEQASVTLNIPGPARLSFRKTDGTEQRINLDDILVTGNNGFVNKVVSVGMEPWGVNIPLSQNELRIRFNEKVQAGTAGKIMLHDVTDNSVQEFAMSASDVTVSDEEVRISGLTLRSAHSYYVTFDSAAVENRSGSLRSTGIYTDDVWNFSMIDTSTPPDITELRESFAECKEPVFGVFRAYSAQGSATWRCGNQGVTDRSSVYINGGFQGGANDNEDWLITAAPVSLDAQVASSLHFYTKTRFTKTTIKQVLISHDYTGSGDPAEARWEVIRDITEEVSGNGNTWKEIARQFSNDHTARPFYLAFKYVSLAANQGAEEWSLDDIRIGRGSASVAAYVQDKPGLLVLGDATPDLVRLQVNATVTGNATIRIFNITGNKVHEQPVALRAGGNLVQLRDAVTGGGVYIVSVTENSGSTSTIKALVY